LLPERRSGKGGQALSPLSSYQCFVFYIRGKGILQIPEGIDFYDDHPAQVSGTPYRHDGNFRQNPLNTGSLPNLVGEYRKDTSGNNAVHGKIIELVFL
jgi:hypothetical protein